MSGGGSVFASREQKNDFRLRHLLSIGTKVLQDVFHSQTGLPRSAIDLHRSLHTTPWKNIIRFCKGFSAKQKALLDPQCYSCTGTCNCCMEVDSDNFDISLLVLLISEFLNVKLGSCVLPDCHDNSISAHLKRLRFVRNRLSHSPTNRISDIEFEKLWSEAETALTWFGCPSHDIEAAKRIKWYNSTKNLFWSSHPVPSFCGRHEEVEMLNEYVLQCQKNNKLHGTVVCGPCLIGKSQVVKAFAVQYASAYPQASVIWIDASTPLTLEDSFIEVAHYLNVQDVECKATKPIAIARKVYDALCSSNCVVVFDNAASYRGIANYLPQFAPNDPFQVSVIITSGSSIWDKSRFCLLNIDAFDKIDAEDFLRESFLHQGVSFTEEDIANLAERFAYLPAPLDQAVRYLSNHRNITVNMYIKDMDALNPTILSLMDNGEKTLFSSLKIIASDLQKKGELYSEVFFLIGYMDSHSIDTMFFSKMEAFCGSEGDTIFTLNNVFDCFSKYSILCKVKSSTVSTSTEFCMNSFVQEVIRSIVHEESNVREEFIQLKLVNLTKAWISDLSQQRCHAAYGKQWLSHALSLLFHTQSQAVLSKLLDVFPELEKALINCARYETLENVCKCFLASSLDICDTLSYHLQQSLSNCIFRSGHLWRALEMFDNLQIRAKELYGEDSAEFLAVRCSLGVVRRKLGEFSVATKLFQELFVDCIKLLGQNHPLTLKSQSNYALLLQDVGYYNNALEIFDILVPKLEERFGKEHHYTLRSKHHMAIALKCEGRLEESKCILNHLLITRTILLGEGHPTTWKTKRTLGLVLHDLGEFDEAEQILTTLVATLQQELGSTHLETLHAKYILGLVLKNSCKTTDALSLFHMVVAEFESQLGKYHPTTISANVSYALMLSDMDELDASIAILQEFSSICEMKFGVCHPLSVNIKENIEIVLSMLEEKVETSSLLQ